MDKDSEPRAVGRLSRPWFWGLLAALLVIFVFANGPIWKNPWAINELDVAIVASYAPIPIFVAIGLATAKKLNWKGLFLDTLELTLLKYCVTFCLALVLWETHPAPVAGTREIHLANALPPIPSAFKVGAAKPTVLDPTKLGAVGGVVKDAGGQPIEGALAYVESGLEGYVFAPPSEPVEVVNDGTRITPRIAAAMLNQPLLARSSDGQLHTLVAERDGVALFNQPLLSSGAPTRVRLVDAHGPMTLRCTVHARSGHEIPGHLAVFSHPFFTRTDAAGRFTLRGIPAGSVVVAAFDPAAGQASRPVTITAGGEPSVEIALVAPHADAR